MSPSTFPQNMRRTVLARRAALALTALALAGVLAYSTALLVAPASPIDAPVLAIAEGDGYVAWAQPAIERDDVIHATWTTLPHHAVPDSILVIQAYELPRLLRGEPLEGRVVDLRGGLDRAGTASNWNGRITVPMVERTAAGKEFPWTCEGCADPRPVLVWSRGDAWVGAAPRDGTMEAAPIALSGVITEHNFDDLVPALGTGTLVACALALAALSWWGLEARGRAALPRREPTTEEMLHLVDRADAYLATLSGLMLAAGGALALAVALLGYVTVPALARAARAHFADPFDAYAAIGGMATFAVLATLGLWAVAYSSLRRERRRWSGVSRDFEDAAQGILEP